MGVYPGGSVAWFIIAWAFSLVVAAGCRLLGLSRGLWCGPQGGSPMMLAWLSRIVSSSPPSWLAGSSIKRWSSPSFRDLVMFLTKCSFRPQSFVAVGLGLVIQTEAKSRVCWIRLGKAQFRFCFWLGNQMISK
uniref:Uncharacterized protein n=1 Tax=Opuntia streptacantha TaxID=393608 RepID=A0A7C9CLZ1_OPUST